MNNRLMQKPIFVKSNKNEAKDNDNKPEISEFTKLESQYEKEQAAVARAE